MIGTASVCRAGWNVALVVLKYHSASIFILQKQIVVEDASILAMMIFSYFI